jgi:hypothetical protein
MIRDLILDCNNKASKLFSTNGSIMTINNELHNRDIRFQFLMSQMAQPKKTDWTGHAMAANEVLSPVNPVWEWTLTLKLYGIE